MTHGWMVLAGIFVLPTRLPAQTDARLVSAVRMAQEGRGDSARVVVQRLLAGIPTTDTLYPQVVYTQAMVANNAQEMRRHLQRVAVEFPTSPWADDALLRLVQLDYATGNLTGAARHLERIRLDYPGTGLYPQAAYWAGRTYFELRNPTLACRWLGEGIERSRGDIETQNQLAFLQQRCDTAGRPAGRPADSGGVARDTGALAAATPAAPAPAPPPRDTIRLAPPAAAPAPTTVYRVQTAAVSTKEAALRAERQLKELGIPVMTVRENGLYKVRAGAYATRAEAQAAAVRLKGRLGGTPFVVAGE